LTDIDADCSISFYGAFVVPWGIYIMEEKRDKKYNEKTFYALIKDI